MNDKKLVCVGDLVINLSYSTNMVLVVTDVTEDEIHITSYLNNTLLGSTCKISEVVHVGKVHMYESTFLKFKKYCKRIRDISTFSDTDIVKYFIVNNGVVMYFNYNTNKWNMTNLINEYANETYKELFDMYK